jgi:membrane protease YdiL (CAAX protease family)
MNAFNHYATLLVVCFLFGHILGSLVQPPLSFLLALSGGIVLGLTWRKVTGYNPFKEKKDE